VDVLEVLAGMDSVVRDLVDAKLSGEVFIR